MPVMDGVEATRRIRALPDGRKVRIAVVTAAILKEDDDELATVGFDAIVHKPFRRHHIFECMERLLKVRYVHAAAAESPAALYDLSTTALAALPAMLRKCLAEAILRLDQERILAVIDDIVPLDAALAEALRERVRNYAYPSILAQLQALPGASDEFVP